MITTFYPPYNFGGDGIFVHRLSNELARRGHRVDVIHCIDAYRLKAGREPANGYDDHLNVTVHGLKSRFGFFSPLATQQTGFPLFKSARIRQILEKGFDVIHYHNISLVGGPKILEYGKGIKLYTLHDYWLVCPTHVLFKFNRAACTRPHCFACGMIYKRPPQWWRHFGLLKTQLKHVDAFIAASLFSKQIHAEMGLNIPIVHLPHFVPISAEDDEASQRPIEETKQKPYFLFVGRLEKLKGLQTLVPVFHRYRKAQLLIAGTGHYESTLRHLAAGADNIHFLGQLSHPQLQLLFRQALGIIVPSICFEVAPLVTIEAFRERAPAIVRNMGGLPEFIKESGGGFVYNTDEELVAAMDQLLADPGCRRRLRLRGYKTFQKKWTAEAHLKSYFSLIYEIAAAHGHPLGQPEPVSKSPSPKIPLTH